MVLYGVLKKHDDGLAELAYLTDTEPETGSTSRAGTGKTRNTAGPS